MSRKDRRKKQVLSDEVEPQAMSSETSSLVELHLTKTFLRDLSGILGTPVNADDPDVNEFVYECVLNDHLSENVTPEIRVLRFDETNSFSVYYTRVTSVVRANGEAIYFRKYFFIKASLGHKWVDRNSSTLSNLGKVLTRAMMIGLALNRAHAVFEKIKSMIMTD